jgi:sugar lactone lactonase YvrE
VRIDVNRQFAYMTDSKAGGIIVLDLKTGQGREVLTGHRSTTSDPKFKFIVDGRELQRDGKPAKINADGIALTPDGNWLYYKPLSDDKLYRVNTGYLRNPTITSEVIATKVQDLGHFATTDGMIFDNQNNLYFGDLQHGRIIRIDIQHKMHTIVEDPRLIWPDSYAISNGYLYISCSQIQKQPEYNDGVNKRVSAYAVYRVKL